MTIMKSSFTGLHSPVFFGSKEDQRKRLCSDVDAFLRSGGIIQRLAPAKHRDRLSARRLEVVRGIYQEVG